MYKWVNSISKPNSIVERAIKRRDIVRKLYDEYREEFYEDNIPTSLYGFFQEILSAMPEDHINREGIKTKALFESALDDLFGDRKIYI